MSKMRVAQVSRANETLEIVERDIPEPGASQVRIKVEACGICHSDAMTREGLWPGIQYPRVPGHEVAGTIDSVGAGVLGWSKGQRAGVGWLLRFLPPRRFVTCQVAPQVPGIAYDVIPSLTEVSLCNCSRMITKSSLRKMAPRRCK